MFFDVTAGIVVGIGLLVALAGSLGWLRPLLERQPVLLGPILPHASTDPAGLLLPGGIDTGGAAVQQSVVVVVAAQQPDVERAGHPDRQPVVATEE